MFIIANNDYKCESFPELWNCVNDGKGFEEAMRSIKSADVEIFAMYNCTMKELTPMKKKFLASIRPGDVVIVFFAGHGLEYQNSNRLMMISETGNPNFKDDSIHMLVLIHEFVTCTPSCERASQRHSHSLCIYMINTTTGLSRGRPGWP